MTDSEYSALDVVGAIQLAMLAGADDRTRSLVVGEILKRAPEPRPGDTASVHLLIEAVKYSKAEFRLTEHERALG